MEDLNRCNKCGEMYATPDMPPENSRICPQCGARVVDQPGDLPTMMMNDTQEPTMLEQQQSDGDYVPFSDAPIPGAKDANDEGETMPGTKMNIGGEATQPSDIHAEPTQKLAGSAEPTQRLAPPAEDEDSQETIASSHPPVAAGAAAQTAPQQEEIGDTRMLGGQRSDPEDRTNLPTVPGTEPIVNKQAAAEADTAPPGKQRYDTPVSRATAPGIDPAKEDLEGRHLSGLVLKKKLGAGGMGSVYLAHQISLDRDVAVKILPNKFAADPSFVARFTREALTAAQLNHHNVIQVFDVGSEQGIHYISMEFVNGSDLGSMTRKEGRLTFEAAVGYVLQAARGLMYAHNRGIIHRDIKPDNLMINEHGVVKIADMGLAKMRHEAGEKIGLDYGGETELKRMARSDLTGASAAMGTPSYMAPEQGKDAGSVDHRADQYSLGCTLYYLVAGKTPFTGKTSFEIISKHLSEPIPPLDVHVKNVPKDLTAIIEKMMSKDVTKRYPTMGDVVETLEAYLGIDSASGTYTPREHHATLLETEQNAFYAAPAIKLRKMVKLGFFAVAALLFIVTLLMKSFFLAGAALGLIVLTPLINFIIHGVLTKDYMFRRVRATFFGMNWKNWVLLVLGSLICAAVLWVVQLLIPWIVVSVLAVGLAFGFQLGIDARLRKQREKAIASMQEMLKQLRIKGVSEEAIHDFVCRFSGEHWEEFFETLFGYENMIMQRHRWATKEKSSPRKKYATWRDPIIRSLDDIDEGRKRRREEKTLAKAEKQRLKATGVDEKQAEKEAAKLAKSAVDEGLIKETVVLEGQQEPAPRSSIITKKRRRPRVGGTIFWLFRLARFAFALLMLGAAGISIGNAMGMDVPQEVIPILQKFYYNQGLGDSVFYNAIGAVIGAFLLISVFSGRIIAPALILLGAISVSYMGLILSFGISGVTNTHLFYGGMGAALLGFVWLILAKLTGKGL